MCGVISQRSLARNSPPFVGGSHYRIDVTTGRLVPSRERPSLHRDARPADCVPELVVVHGISLPPGVFGTPWPETLLAGGALPDEPWVGEDLRALRVSAHLLIDRAGEVVQFVPFHERAWHAGRSRWRGRTSCNDFSVGIELEGSDTVPYTDAQYRILAEVVSTLRAAYPSLTGAPVVGHSNVAPGRKTDPGPAFLWARFARFLVAAEAARV
jgi:AmpD protein